MEETNRLLKPKIDVVFHSLFRKGNEGITKAMISTITQKKIKEINLDTNVNIIGRYPEEKTGVLDLKAILDDGVICNIEVQLADNKDTAERFLYYWSRLYSSQLEKGNEYKELNKVIGIIILDYNYEKTKEIEDLYTKWKIKEEKHPEIELTDKLELHIIEIPKAKKIIEKEPNNKIAEWMLFLNDPNEEEVSKIMKSNEEIKEAMDMLEKISKDHELRRIIELKEKFEHDEASRLGRIRDESIEERFKRTE